MGIKEERNYINCQLDNYIASLPNSEASRIMHELEDDGKLAIYLDNDAFLGSVKYGEATEYFYSYNEYGKYLGCDMSFKIAMDSVLGNAGIFFGRTHMEGRDSTEASDKDPSKIDMVSRPPHYTQYSVECIQIIEEMGLAEGFCRGNALKYLWRAGDKGNKVEDLRKAAWYATRLADYLEKKENE